MRETLLSLTSLNFLAAAKYSLLPLVSTINKVQVMKEGSLLLLGDRGRWNCGGVLLWKLSWDKDVLSHSHKYMTSMLLTYESKSISIFSNPHSNHQGHYYHNQWSMINNSLMMFPTTNPLNQTPTEATIHWREKFQHYCCPSIPTYLDKYVFCLTKTFISNLIWFLFYPTFIKLLLTN